MYEDYIDCSTVLFPGSPPLVVEYTISTLMRPWKREKKTI